MYIIIGLGNPGKKYENTRHNVGFMVLDTLAKKTGSSWETNKKFQAEICQGGNTILVKPQTFINNSGRGVQAVLSFYKLLPKKFGLIKEKNSNLADILTVIHDDIDISLGKYKISVDSRSAGHKGVESIINHLKTKNFKRIRIGIRTEMANRMPAEKFVLENFREEELKIVDVLINKIISEISI